VRGTTGDLSVRGIAGRERMGMDGCSTWVQYMEAYTWTQYMDAVHGRINMDAVHGCGTWTQYMDTLHGCIRRKARPSRARPSFPTLRPPSTSTPAGMDCIGLSGTRARIPKDIRVHRSTRKCPRYGPDLRQRGVERRGSPVPEPMWRGKPSPRADAAPPDESRRYRRRGLARR
jgi:hypothetical protein